VDKQVEHVDIFSLMRRFCAISVYIGVGVLSIFFMPALAHAQVAVDMVFPPTLPVTLDGVTYTAYIAYRDTPGGPWNGGIFYNESTTYGSSYCTSLTGQTVGSVNSSTYACQYSAGQFAWDTTNAEAQHRNFYSTSTPDMIHVTNSYAGGVVYDFRDNQMACGGRDFISNIDSHVLCSSLVPPVDTTTRIISMFPTNGTTTGTIVPFAVHAYISPDDMGTFTAVTITLHNIDQNVLLRLFMSMKGRGLLIHTMARLLMRTLWIWWYLLGIAFVGLLFILRDLTPFTFMLVIMCIGISVARSYFHSPLWSFESPSIEKLRTAKWTKSILLAGLISNLVLVGFLMPIILIICALLTLKAS